ncbi:MAG: diguanylate cyclase [Acidobacteria bacterium]|nr:diguanylate cyclase [Acidobacteriota bacterium]
MLFLDFQSPHSLNTGLSRNAADQALASLADIIRRTLRGADILFRYSSEALVVLLNHTDSEAASAVMGRLAHSIKNATARSSSECRDFSFFIGTATAPEDGTSLEALVEAARKRGRSANDGSISPPSVH